MCSSTKGEMRKSSSGNHRVRRRKAMFALSIGLGPTEQRTRGSMRGISRTTTSKNTITTNFLGEADSFFFLQHQHLQSSPGHHNHHQNTGFTQNSGNLAIPTNTGFAYQQPRANHYGIQDPILQDQPLLPAVNQYEVKRENEGIYQDNPFLVGRGHRQPKSIVMTIKKLDNDGSQGWVPIPYPLYK